MFDAILAGLSAMPVLELFATLFTIACVILVNLRSLWQYPVGLVGTALYCKVFYDVGLFASSALQIVFAAVMLYGWWYWLFGDQGKRPPIRRLGLEGLGMALGVTFIISYAVGAIINQTTDAAMAMLDTQIFGMSVLAQFLLDRKRIEHWFVWMGVNVISVYVYGSQGLVLTTFLYAFFLINSLIGFLMWRKEFNQGRPVKEATV